MNTMITPSPDDEIAGSHSHIIPFDANEDFNQDLDEQCGSIEVAGFTFRASQVLHTMEPEGYRLALQDFQQQRIEEYKETIYNEFPTPVAYHFYTTEYGYENEVQRLHCLRDVWESLVYMLYALVIGEFRFSQIPLFDVKIAMKQFLSNSISDKLATIAVLLNFASKQKYELACCDFVSHEIIQKIHILNRARNAFSHSAAISEEQARQYFTAHYDPVLSILQQVSALSKITLLRFTSSGGSGKGVRECRFETFVGHAMTRRYKTLELTRDQYNSCIDYLHPDNILVLYKDHIYSLSPFIHFVPRDEGHQTRLCLYKERKGGEYHYEVLGETRQQTFLETNFASVQEELQDLLVSPPTERHSS